MNLKFLVKKLKGYDFSKIKETAKRVSKITGKSWLSHYVDIIICSQKHGSGQVDYEEYKMYNMSEKERANVLTINKNNEIYKKYTDQRFKDYFDDKVVFNKKFDKYIKREWLALGEDRVFGKREGSLVPEEDCLRGAGFEAFKDFVKGKEYIMLKPVDQKCGKGIQKVKVSDWDLKELYDFAVNNTPLVEEVAVQCDEMNLLSSSSVNTIRLVTLKKGENVYVLSGCVRMGKPGSVVDNFNSGGISACLDVSRGVILSNGYDKNRENYENAIESGIKIQGFEIPDWNEVVDMVKEAALIVPEVGYIGWDVCIAKDRGPCFIEGNAYPGADATQNIEYNAGTYGKFKEILNGEI